MDWPLRFGVFLAPFHQPGQNPTLALERDLELLEWLDTLGYDEAWIGEHHSGGWEIIASPEVFIATAAARTGHIRLGTGVSSLPYHHPLLLVDRLVLLDHLTKGRVMFGVGPGQLATDAHMLGIDTNAQRRMMEESLEAIVALLEADEPITRQTDWFTLRDARLQLRPYSHPRFEICVAASFSPAGPKSAARFGAGLLSIAATQEAGFDALGYHWGVMEEVASAHGRSVDRQAWRLMGPMHIAESVGQAKADMRHGFDQTFTYLRHALPVPPELPGTLEDRIDAANANHSACIGTAEMAIAQIQRLIDRSGGFGCYLFMGADFADRAATRRSYELFAQEVMPHFQGQLEPPKRSEAWLLGSEGEFVNRTVAAIGDATASYEAEKMTRQAASGT